MLFVLSGPSGVGKSYCVEYMCHTFDFKTLTPYTTREPRISESEGFHYHFRSDDELRKMTANLSLGYWAQPLKDGCLYGYTSHVDTLVNDPRNWVIQAYTDIALAIKARSPKTVLVFLDFADDETLRDRIRQRYQPAGSVSISHRLAHAKHERAVKDRYDYRILSNSPEQIARELTQIVLSLSVSPPLRSINQPGPLADVDIRSSLDSPDGLRIEGVSRKDLLARISGWSVDLTLAPRYYRVVRRVLIRRVFDLARGNSADMLTRFRECVVKDGQGVYLRPQEFILASTAERLSIPARMVCLLSGRSSYSRMGVSVDLSQIVLQPGHDDVIPLQIKNHMPYPIIVYPGISIAQAVFFNTISPSSTPYNVGARAKYPPHVDDVRSRYFVDAAYEGIRSGLPKQQPIDWDHVLIVLLVVVASVTGASWLVTHSAEKSLAGAGRYLEVLFFVGTIATAVIAFVRLIRGKRQ